MASKWTELLAEARRRRVFRTAGVYLVAVWGISQGAVELAPLFGASDWMLRTGVIVAVALLPVVVILAWMFDIGRGGIVRDPQDQALQQAADQELASMPTVLGGEAGAGVVLVRWQDATGENTVLFTDDFHIGRGTDCRVRYYDPLVSRQHARVYQEGEAWIIEDLDSRNGTTVDEAKIDQQPLASSQSVRVNDTGPVLALEWLPPGPEARSAMSEYPLGSQTAHVRLVANEPVGRTPSAWKR